MKRIHLVALVVAGVLTLLALTNPPMDAYERYVHDNLIVASNKQGGLRATLGVLFSGAASSYVANATVRSNYLFFSVYQTHLGRRTYTSLGLMGGIFMLRNERSAEAVD